MANAIWSVYLAWIFIVVVKNAQNDSFLKVRVVVFQSIVLSHPPFNGIFLANFNC